MRAALMVTTALTASALLAAPAHAGSWTAGTGDWFDPANWDSGVPTAGDYATLDNGGTAQIDAPGAVSQGVAVGFNSDTSGTVEVSGSGASWTNTYSIYLGYGGHGALDITDGGQVTTEAAFLGFESTGLGELNVDGDGSLFDVSSALTIGNEGEGRLTITSGAAVNSGSGSIGAAGGTGSVTVDGEGSSWYSQYEIMVGNNGQGRLDIANGGSVTSDSYVQLGGYPDSTGTVTVDGEGSTLDAAGDLWVGVYGEGILEITNGGAVRNDEGALGVLGSGRATVDGEGSSWINTGRLFIGDTGDGSLEITNGGVVSSSAESVIAMSFDSRGRVTVDGEGSSWIGTSSLDVAMYGDGALEIANGGLVESGEVRVGSHIESTGSVMVDGENSTLEAGAMLTVGLFGDGTLNITNGGTVRADRFRAGVQVDSSGTTLVDGAGSSLIIASSEEVSQFGIFGDAVLTVSNGGSVSAAGTMLVGQTDISSATINIGAAADEEATAAGTFAVGHIIFGGGDSKIIFNHIDTNFELASHLSGSATLRQIGSGTTTLSGSSGSFWGATAVEAGTLIVNGVLGGSLDVADARLGGSGTVGTTVLGAGAVIAPGNSVGILTVDGDLTFDADSTYEVEVDTVSRTADRIYVTGIAYLNGASVSHVGYCGCYPWYMTQTILTADGGIDGTFSGITSDFAFLTPDLAYDANNVRMTLLRNDIDFTEVTQSPNQMGVASAANGLGPGNPIYDQIVAMTEEEARAAFDALSGEAYGSAGSAAFNSAQQLRDVLQVRLQMFSGGQVAASGYVPAAGDALAADAPAVWGQLFGSWGVTDASATAAKLDRRSSGFLGGADKAVGEKSRIGFALGYSRSTFDVSARASSGDSDNVHIAGYAATELGSVDLDGTLGYSYGRSEATRTVIVGGLTNDLAADYDTHTVQASVEAGMDVGMGSAMLTPFAGLAVTHVRSDGFTETGGPAALTISASDNTTGTSTLGLRVRREAGGVALTGSAAWRHAFGDVEPATRAAFASAPAAPFVTRGTPVSEDTLALGGDIDLKVADRTTLTFGYAGEYASDARDHGLRAEVRVEF
ncbi:MAG: autotransporter domain-containing protein [Parvibaculum sp.]